MITTDLDKTNFQIQEQYRNQLEYLHAKISKQEQEIDYLKNVIALRTKPKLYDC